MEYLVVAFVLATLVIVFLTLAIVLFVLAMVFVIRAVDRLCRVANHISADRIACSPRIDNGEPVVHPSPDARKVRLVCGG